MSGAHDRPTVVLTVSGRIPDDLAAQVAEGRRPRTDYVEIARRMSADLVDVDVALESTGRIGRLLHRIAGAGPLLGWYLFRARRRYDVFVTDGEQVGLPLAVLTRLFGRASTRHVMIVHILSAPKKIRLVRLGRLADQIDRYVVYCSRQADLITERLGVARDAIVQMPFMVDTEFFADRQVAEHPADGPTDETPRPMICSAGLERRDYPTLIEAVRGLDVDVVIAAASPWSTQTDTTRGAALPDNVTVRRFDLHELRALYARSAFVVMPLQQVEFQAGITTILEAMSMSRAVVCTRTPGQTDTIIDGETGVYVAPGDVDGLRRAIVRLLADDDLRRRLGESARAWVVHHADVEVYAESIAAVVAELDSAR